ncbi:hypothetical protein C3B47_14290 [Flavobacterium columnare]|uniref:DUF3871 family protein n=1 Tax=Flavobacterium columnare TaxID=996 RepID=UPI0018965D77|nr:DUF3871 family protein [Flavobacterium columnare]MBF6654024.1 hypothetical protein [Flavobacterium columnare]MBF6655052.1 hypothetical protein [Flavobacterium columnare]
MEMELHTIEQSFKAPAKEDIFLPAGTENLKKTSPFIEANTEEVSLSHLKNGCIIPVFTKDNEITISHQEFIDSSFAGLKKIFVNEVIDAPEIRVSHQIKGRTPDALQIPAKDLEEHQKTIYYERMAFIIRIPSITRKINGNTLSLVAGGVRSYNLENLYNTKKLESFQFFIGFQNMVCCNLCVNTDGFKSAIKASSAFELEHRISEVIQDYDMHQHIENMNLLTEQTISEKQFAQIIGKSRLYNYLPKNEKNELPELLLNDSHISAIAKEYYNDESFRRDNNGNINLWNFYNLMTGSNKASYIDTFLERGVNAFDFTKGVSNALSDSNSNYSWFLS